MQEPHGFDPWVRKILWRRKWQLTPVFLPKKSHGQRSLVGCSPKGNRELNTTKTEHTAQVLVILSIFSCDYWPSVDILILKSFLDCSLGVNSSASC